MSKSKGPRKYRFQILTPKQLADLDVGPTRVIQIPAKEAYEQTRIIRQPQQLKNKCVQDFAEDWGAKAEKYGTNAEDRRLLAKLMDLVAANAVAHAGA